MIVAVLPQPILKDSLPAWLLETARSVAQSKCPMFALKGHPVDLEWIMPKLSIKKKPNAISGVCLSGAKLDRISAWAKPDSSRCTLLRHDPADMLEKIE